METGPGAPLQPEDIDSVDYNLRLAQELSDLFAKMQSEGNVNDHVDEIFKQYEAINIYAGEESVSDSDRMEPNESMDTSDKGNEILDLTRPIATFLRTKGRIS